ncbi:MAG: CopG family antitoxin [Candidatus Gottesmanbacteria bacterium]|nr:CopG family antitoxin [Candidatus Gottesmanbacteria bacterium]
MKKKNIDSIPHFKSYFEEAEFWDSHSFADYWDTWKDVDIVFDLDSPREESLIVRLQKSFKHALAKTAMRKGLNVSTLARMWLMEKLQEDVRSSRAVRAR